MKTTTKGQLDTPSPVPSLARERKELLLLATMKNVVLGFFLLFFRVTISARKLEKKNHSAALFLLGHIIAACVL